MSQEAGSTPLSPAPVRPAHPSRHVLVDRGRTQDFRPAETASTERRRTLCSPGRKSLGAARREPGHRGGESGSGRLRSSSGRVPGKGRAAGTGERSSQSATVTRIASRVIRPSTIGKSRPRPPHHAAKRPRSAKQDRAPEQRRSARVRISVGMRVEDAYHRPPIGLGGPVDSEILAGSTS